MTQQEFDRLWTNGEFSHIWNREKAIEALEHEAKYPNGNVRSRAEARRALNEFLEQTKVVTQ